MSVPGDTIQVTPATGQTRLVPPSGVAVGQAWQLKLLNLTPYNLMVNLSGKQDVLAAGLIHNYSGSSSIDATVTPIVPVGATGTGEIIPIWAFGTDSNDGTYPVPSLIQANNVTIVGGTVSVTGSIQVVNDQIILINDGTASIGSPIVALLPADSPPIHALSIYAKTISNNSLVSINGHTTGRLFYYRHLLADIIRFDGPVITPCTSALEDGFVFNVDLGDAVNDIYLIGYSSAVPPLPTPVLPAVQAAAATVIAGPSTPLLPLAPVGQSYVLESWDANLFNSNEVILTDKNVVIAVTNHSQAGISLDKYVGLGPFAIDSSVSGTQVSLRYRLSYAPDGFDVNI